MSQSVTVAGATKNGHLTGLITIPIDSGLPESALHNLQLNLTSLSFNVLTGTTGLTNLDVAGQSGAISIAASPMTGTNLLEFSNLSVGGAAGHGHGHDYGGMNGYGLDNWQAGGTNDGNDRGHGHSGGDGGRGSGRGTGGGTSTTPGMADIIATVPSGYQTVIVQAPGNITLTGNGALGESYLFGASSNVDLNTHGGTGSIVAGGGANTLNLSGNYAVTLAGGSDAVTVTGGSDTIRAFGTKTALQFVNQSTERTTVFAGAGSATIFGGAGGGSFHAGAVGVNSLIGGAGAVSLFGRASGDILEAGESTDGATVGGINNLQAGAGNETLLASSLTGANKLVAGSGSDSISSDGSGLQTFYGGRGSATITSSTMAGSTNIYLFGAASAPGGADLISNFKLGKDVFEGLNGATISTITASSFGGQAGALVTLSDGTHVQLAGVSAASISSSIGKSGFV